MEVIPSDLVAAAHAGRERLALLASSAAVANAKGGTSATQGSMAAAAREAIFTDALLSAVHARLEELRSIAK